MIAHNLALGRRVLFVAEKKAALDVVYRRLEAQGLGEFCLELHSSKTSKMDFLKQLERAWDARDLLTTSEWKEEAAKVQHLRDKLNEVVRLLHLRWPNGLTLHQAMGTVIRDASSATPHFSWPASTLHSSSEMTQFREIVKRLELNRDTGNSTAIILTSSRRLTGPMGGSLLSLLQQIHCLQSSITLKTPPRNY